MTFAETAAIIRRRFRGLALTITGSLGLGLLGAYYFPPQYEAWATLIWRQPPEQSQGGESARKAGLLEEAGKIMFQAQQSNRAPSPGGPGPGELLASLNKKLAVKFLPATEAENQFTFRLSYRDQAPGPALAGLSLWQDILAPPAPSPTDKAELERSRARRGEAQKVLDVQRAVLSEYELWNVGKLPEHEALNQHMIQVLQAEAEDLDHRLTAIERLRQKSRPELSERLEEEGFFQGGRPLAALGSLVLSETGPYGGLPGDTDDLWRAAVIKEQKNTVNRKLREYQERLNATNLAESFRRSLLLDIKRTEAGLEWLQSQIDLAVAARSYSGESGPFSRVGPGQPELMEADSKKAWWLALGLLGGIPLGLLFLIISEAASNRVYQAKTVTAITGWTVAGVLPEVRKNKNVASRV